MYVDAFQEFGDMETCYKEIIACKKDIAEPDFDEENLAEKEIKLLGVNIRFIHPLLEQAQFYTSVTDLIDKETATVAVRILTLFNKITKRGKPYIMMRVQCLNSNEIENFFAWDPTIVTSMGFKENQMTVLNVKKDGDFHHLAMSKNYKG